MNTNNPNQPYYYRRITGRSHRAVFSAYCACTGRYVCRVFALDSGWSNGRSRDAFKSKSKAVDAYIEHAPKACDVSRAAKDVMMQWREGQQCR
jgi:hypothetical protein